MGLVRRYVYYIVWMIGCIAQCVCAVLCTVCCAVCVCERAHLVEVIEEEYMRESGLNDFTSFNKFLHNHHTHTRDYTYLQIKNTSTVHTLPHTIV